MELEALLMDDWKNGACLGYAIKAAEQLGYRPEEIQRLVDEMRSLFDWDSVDEADKHYCNSPY